MKQRLLTAPLPILVVGLLLFWDYRSGQHMGVLLLMTFVAGGSTWELNRGYANRYLDTAPVFASVLTGTYVFWMGLYYLDPWDLLGTPPASSALDGGIPGSLAIMIPVLLVIFLFLAFSWLHLSRERVVGALFGLATFALFAGIYTSVVLCLYFLSTEEYGATLWIFFLIAHNKCADTGAYTAGKWLGTHQMTPKLSPNKTWEGLGGALLTGVIVGLLFWYITPLGNDLSTGTMIAVSLFLALTGAGGDLIGSGLKRGAGLDDSSPFLGGLGGILDLTDCFLLTFPAGFFAIILVL